MTATLGLAFAAGILTVAAPCVLPLLPVVVGGAMVRAGDERRARWRPFIIAGSLVISVVLFTLLLKATTALLGIPRRSGKSSRAASSCCSASTWCSLRCGIGCPRRCGCSRAAERCSIGR